METVEGEEVHVYDVGFLNEDAAARRVPVDRAAEAAEGGAFSGGEGGVLGAGAERVVAHFYRRVRGGE